MPPRTSLKTFLATARAALTAPPSKRPTPLTFVVGNESADLDSLCSALLLAYFETYTPKKRASVSDRNASTTNNNNLHIPVCHLYRADLALRPEFAAVLRDADVTGDDMVTLEDVIPSHHHHNESNTSKTGSSAKAAKHSAEPIRPEDTRWLLVDHNAMTGILAKTFASRVTGCIDHHADEDVIPRDADPRVIAKTGSCTTLVLEHCAVDAWGPDPQTDSATTESLEAAKIKAQLARLALAPILIDTAGLQDKDKTTPRDERAVARAEAHIAAYEALLPLTRSSENNDDEKRYDRGIFFERTAALKEDLTEMSFRDIFRKDYKEWSCGRGGLYLGTSSMPRGFGYLLDQKARGDAGVIGAALREWGDERDEMLRGAKMDLVAVFIGFKDDEGEFQRELLIWARSEAGVKAAEVFERTWSDELRLEAWGDGVLDLKPVSKGGAKETEWRRCWRQGALAYSRKQIAPMLRDALGEVAG